MDIAVKLAIIAGWYLLTVGSVIAFWYWEIWLIRRRYINQTGAGISFAALVLVATYLCSLYK